MDLHTRLNSHITEFRRCRGSSQKECWFEELDRKHLLSQLSIVSLDTLPNRTLALVAEKRWICRLRRHRFLLTNMLPGGNGFPLHSTTDQKFTPKMREALVCGLIQAWTHRVPVELRQTWASLTTEQQHRFYFRHPGSPEVRAKNATTHVGRIASPETCAKMAKNWRNGSVLSGSNPT